MNEKIQIDLINHIDLLKTFCKNFIALKRSFLWFCFQCCVFMNTHSGATNRHNYLLNNNTFSQWNLNRTQR